MKIFNKFIWSKKEPSNKNDIWFDGSTWRMYTEEAWQSFTLPVDAADKVAKVLENASEVYQEKLNAGYGIIIEGNTISLDMSSIDTDTTHNIGSIELFDQLIKDKSRYDLHEDDIKAIQEGKLITTTQFGTKIPMLSVNHMIQSSNSIAGYILIFYVDAVLYNMSIYDFEIVGGLSWKTRLDSLAPESYLSSNSYNAIQNATVTKKFEETDEQLTELSEELEHTTEVVLSLSPKIDRNIAQIKQVSGDVGEVIAQLTELSGKTLHSIGGKAGYYNTNGIIANSSTVKAIDIISLKDINGVEGGINILEGRLYSEGDVVPSAVFFDEAMNVVGTYKGIVKSGENISPSSIPSNASFVGFNILAKENILLIKGYGSFSHFVEKERELGAIVGVIADNLKNVAADTILFTSDDVAADDVISYRFYSLNSAIGFYNAEGTRLAMSSYSEKGEYVTGEYVIPQTFAFAKAIWATIDIDKILNKTISNKALAQEVSSLKDEVSDVANSMVEQNEQLAEKVNVTYSVNLFNKDSEDILDAYIGLKGYVLASGYKITHPIKVSKGVTYKVAHNANLGSEGYCARCEADGTWIKSILMTSSNGYDTITADFDGYMRFSMGSASPDTFMVCIAEDYPTSYVPYRKLIEPSVYVPSFNILGGGINNPLMNKILAVDGDSICEGISNGGGYAKIIAERNNMVVQNLGISGGTLAETFRADGTRRHCISLNVSNLREDADYIILEGGVNDGELIGEANKRFEGDFDYTTMIGALDTLFASLYARFPGKKIGFIIVHSVNENWSAGGERYEAALAACKKWGIPVCDLSTSCPPFGCMSSDNPLRVTYTTNGDGYHPTDEGYKKYYCDKIEAWMKTL